MKLQVSKILKQVFGYDTFREKQKEVIINVLNKKDTLAVMPTGSGKSLCYQIPAIIFKGITVVVSPLISLMEDQVNQLLENGIQAVLLNSSISRELYQENIQQLRNGEAKLLYVAPETLLKENIIELLTSLSVDCFTIDEAHCISEWGHDFRPEYRRLLEVRKMFPQAVCIGLTATATHRVREDIRKSLFFNSPFEEFLTSFDRKNLFLEITDKTDGFKQITDFLEDFPGESGIIYCLTRKKVDEITTQLRKKGYKAKSYHAGLGEDKRKKNQSLFLRDDIQIMVATIAFGMGINKSNVRYVIHHDIPQNIESYYQQIGRAGRDGLNSHCLMLFSYGDIHKIKYFINQKSSDEQRIANIHLNDLIRVVETPDCRRTPILHYFGEEHSLEKCGFCDNCTTEKKEQLDLTIEAQKFLSCVKRTGELFGAGHIIDVLRGSQSQKVLEKSHHLLSTYNIGSDYSKKQWFHFCRQFLNKDLLIQDSLHGSLKLTEKSQYVLKKELSVFGLKTEDKPAKVKKVKGSFDYDETLFEILRTQRKQIADQKNVPAFVILSNRSLMEMSVSYPVTQEEFLNINGIGLAKYEKFGKIFSTIISDYKKEKGL